MCIVIDEFSCQRWTSLISYNLPCRLLKDSSTLDGENNQRTQPLGTNCRKWKDLVYTKLTFTKLHHGLICSMALGGSSFLCLRLEATHCLHHFNHCFETKGTTRQQVFSGITLSLYRDSLRYLIPTVKDCLDTSIICACIYSLVCLHLLKPGGTILKDVLLFSRHTISMV